MINLEIKKKDNLLFKGHIDMFQVKNVNMNDLNGYFELHKIDANSPIQLIRIWKDESIFHLIGNKNEITIFYEDIK